MWPNPQFPPDLVTFTEEMLNGKLHFLCSVMSGCFWEIRKYAVYGMPEESYILAHWSSHESLKN